MIGGLLGDTADQKPRCSSAGCTSGAAKRVNWRNPRIHGPDRVKVWLGCEVHHETLAEYLTSRGFPVVVTPLDVPVDVVPDPA